MKVGDTAIVRYKSFNTETNRPAVVIRLTKTLVIVETTAGQERRFHRDNGCETVPGGGYSSNTRLVRKDGTTYSNI
jgi:hypothetical protein